MITDNSKNISTSAVTSTELGYLDGVTSNIQNQLNGKAASSHTHTGTQVKGLTTNRALISNGSGQVAVSGVTSTQLGYLSGATSNIQSQINTLNTNRITQMSLGSSGAASNYVKINGGLLIMWGKATITSHCRTQVGNVWRGSEVTINFPVTSTADVYVVANEVTTSALTRWIHVTEPSPRKSFNCFVMSSQQITDNFTTFIHWIAFGRY